MDQENTMSDWKLNRMKKGDIIAVLRETEEKLFGANVGHKMFVEQTDTEIQELNERIDDHMIQEAMNKKTINELNESNKKLMEKVKFYQDQKENNKKKDNKVADYINNGLIEKIELLEKEKQELIEECKEKNVKNEQLEEEVQKWKEQVEENYKHHYEQLEPVLLENEKLKAENKRFRSKMMGFQNLLSYTSDEFKSILRQHPNPNVIDPLVNKFINEKCEEIENDTSGVEEIAPTELDNLYCDFKEWSSTSEHVEQHYMKRHIFKENLKIWQANSRFGIDIGEKKSDAGVNGYEARPRFNLKVI
jgi:chromosome segregation ATPase